MTDIPEHISQQSDSTANEAVSSSEQPTAAHEVWTVVQRGTFLWEGYEVSSLGHVRRVWHEDGQRRTEPVEPEVLPDGRLVVLFPKGRETRRSLLCKLVAEAFFGVQGPDWYFVFRDGDQAKCTVENLICVSRAVMSPEAKAMFGVPIKPYKLRPDVVRAIRAEVRAGVDPKIIQERWGVGKTMAERLASGKSYPMIPDLPPGVTAKKQVADTKRATASEALCVAGDSQ